MLHLFCSNSHPSNSHSASHQGKAEDDEDDKNEKGRRRKDTDDDEDENVKGRSHDEEEEEDKTEDGHMEAEVTIIFLESTGHSRILEKTEQYDMWFCEFAGNRRFEGSEFRLSCGYVLRGSEFYMCICSGYRNK